MARDPWYDSDNPSTVVRGASWRTALWIIGLVVFVGLLSAGIWAFEVATSDVKGKGDATRTVNAGGNRLAQQAYFEQTYADIKASDRKLDALAAAAKAQPTDDAAATRLLGAENYCQGLIGDYNAAARKQIAAKFRAVDLPAQIDTTNTETDCEPTK
jgi:hypothetical protein